MTAMVFSACSSSEQTADSGLEKFTVLLDWTPNTNHTGLYVAKQKGYFEQEGLDVDIVSADGGNTLEMLASGSGDAGISFEENVTAARVASPPLNVKAVAAVLQENTSGFAALAEKNIKTVKDFEGKTYGSWGTDVESAILKGMMEKAGADYSKVNVQVTNALDNLSMLQSDADFAWIYYGWDGVSAKTQGIDLDFILLQDIDPDMNFYSPLIAASDETIENKSEQLKKFLSAAGKGYKYAVDNPDEAAEILCGEDSSLDLDMVKESQRYVNQYYLNDDGEWGVMDGNVWSSFTDFLYENEVVETKPDYKTLFTNELL